MPSEGCTLGAGTGGGRAVRKLLESLPEGNRGGLKQEGGHGDRGPRMEFRESRSKTIIQLIGVTPAANIY